jgi:RNA recognition motif-containing protein
VYANGWVVPESVFWFGIFSIGWFLAGLLCGRRMAPRTDAGGGRRQKNNRRGGQKPVSADGSVEIYVGNLSYDVTQKDLEECFEAYGKVASVRLIENKFNGKSKGFGFVEMADRGEAMAAISALEGKEYKGRKIVVNEARSRSRA